MLVEINKDNYKSFLGVALEEELLMLGDSPDYFGIGYVDDPESPPLGAIIFSSELEEGEEGDEEEYTVLAIRSYFVPRQHRSERIATILFAELLKVAQSCGATAIRADVSMDSEYDILCNMLADFGFEFFLTELFELTLTLSEILKSPMSQYAKQKLDITPLKNISQNEFINAISELGGTDDIIYEEVTAHSCHMGDFETDISGVVKNDGRIDCILLVCKRANGNLVPVFFRYRDGLNAQYAIMALAGFADRCAQKYPPTTPIYIKCMRKEDALLVDRFFPQKEPLLVRRGYFYL